MNSATFEGLQTPPSVLWKAFDVLGAFNHDRRVQTLSEIARRAGLPKSTTHRILLMLQEVRAVERVEGGYAIGLRMFSVASTSVDSRLRELALPHLERLRRLTRQTVHLAVLRDGDAVYLEKLPSPVAPATPALIGGRLPAARTGVGKALLAFTAEPSPSEPERRLVTGGQRAAIRRAGYATDREEAARGLACVAAPVLVANRAVAAISVAFAAQHGDGSAFVNPVRETAVAVARTVANLPSLIP
ncbi:IclR family transcriptional regulator [Amycolatopsis sp. GA6-003]|uniref:IclR family transcriptional regulator n=1 Tax=Amycolatopsis sp. GA6-003 TaxID=2652444 RepID=UPI0039174B6C